VDSVQQFHNFWQEIRSVVATLVRWHGQNVTTFRNNTHTSNLFATVMST